MSVDHIRYDLLTQNALRSVVRRVLIDAGKNGLPGEHHFYISFDTQAPGVRMSQRLRAQYPEEMTIVLQHQFWDLSVTEHTFEVGLSFEGIPERLLVPFEALKGFVDPSVQFGLRFETVPEDDKQPILEHKPPSAATMPEPKAAKSKGAQVKEPATAKSTPKAEPSKKEAAKADAKAEPKSEPEPKPEAKPDPEPDTPSTGGAEVVRLDRFRKKK